MFWRTLTIYLFISFSLSCLSYLSVSPSYLFLLCHLSVHLFIKESNTCVPENTPCIILVLVCSHFEVRPVLLPDSLPEEISCSIIVFCLFYKEPDGTAVYNLISLLDIFRPLYIYFLDSKLTWIPEVKTEWIFPGKSHFCSVILITYCKQCKKYFSMPPLHQVFPTT